MRLALKIAYDGTAFHGEARQPSLHTVEGEVIHALSRARVIRDGPSSRLQSASRTDRGVSALGNVVAFDSDLRGPAALRAFNGKARGVWAWAVADVPEDFNPRKAEDRWYRYVLSSAHDFDSFAGTLSLFCGEHDFRNFTRDRTRTTVRIDAATVSREDAAIVLDFRAPSFRWNLVRRLVAAALLVERDPRARADVERALRGSARMDLGLAAPEPLTLMDVRYTFEFDPVGDPTTRERLRRLLEERVHSARFAEALAGKLGALTRQPPNV